ncbi:unnamed protein product [Ceutorhynchus assimilis]|uniref:THAP-type domain-containing protein n=1 Tax=Ceutorhynchus assimilis TaxID=467358 RepID=A0A9N9MFP6_9CUCU|nr:unnamed protein product [Ceutorhynchus assimilis]
MAVAMDIKKEVDEEDAYLLDADSQYSLNEAINIKIENDLADSSDVFKKNVSKRVNTWPRRVKTCFVRGCLSNSEGFPTKVLITIPRNENRRRAWFEAARQPYITNNSTRYCCEDHFNVPDDFENYMRFRFMGGPIFVKKHVVPHKFKWWSVPSLESSSRGEEEIYVLSGSEVRPNWKHYESMKFLNDCMVAPRAITSIIGVQDMPASTSTSPEPQIPKRTKRLRQRLDEREESTSVIVETISLPPPPISIPSPTINPICQRLSEMLGTLNGEDRLDLEIELLQLAKKFINENKKN